MADEDTVLHMECEEPVGLGSGPTDEAVGLKHSSETGVDMKIGIISTCMVYLLLTDMEPF